MTTREILAEIDMRGLSVTVTRVLEAGHPYAWSASFGPHYTETKNGPSFDAALLAAWQAHTARVAA